MLYISKMNRFGSLSCKLFLVQFTFTQLWRKSKSSDPRKEKIFYWYFLLGCCSVLPITGVYLHVCGYSYLRLCAIFGVLNCMCAYTCIHTWEFIQKNNNNFCPKMKCKAIFKLTPGRRNVPPTKFKLKLTKGLSPAHWKCMRSFSPLEPSDYFSLWTTPTLEDET